jgi:tetratricopeptide (TPR) repeat protein
MYNSLEDIYNKHNLHKFNINRYINYEKQIICMFNNKVIDYDTNDTNILLWIGIYYNIQHDYDKMDIYYLIALERGNIDSMYYLGMYYCYIEKNYDKTEYYYLMAIESGNDIHITHTLGYFYQTKACNYTKMKYYYLLSIKRGCTDSMNNLAYYYYEKKDYIKSMEYYLMSFEENKNICSIFALGSYYKKIEDYDKMKYYYSFGSNDKNVVHELGKYYKYIEEDYDKAKQNFLIGIIKNCYLCEYEFIDITIPLERYILYKENNIKFTEEITSDMYIYDNKLLLSKIDYCGVCLQDKVECIILSCFRHYICKLCYIMCYKDSCIYCKLK